MDFLIIYSLCKGNPSQKEPHARTEISSERQDISGKKKNTSYLSHQLVIRHDELGNTGAKETGGRNLYQGRQKEVSMVTCKQQP